MIVFELNICRVNSVGLECFNHNEDATGSNPVRGTNLSHSLIGQNGWLITSCYRFKSGWGNRFYPVLENCGFIAPRDLNSAWNIEDEGLGVKEKIGAERIESTPVERRTPTGHLLECLNNIPTVSASSLVESGSRAYL